MNKAIGGAKNSQHTLGEAADIVASNGDNKRLYDLVMELGLPFDQLIDEYGYQWVHVSYTERRGPRRQAWHER